MEEGGRKHGMSQTASKLKAVLITRKGSVKYKGAGKRRVGDGPALNEDEKAYSLAQDVARAAPTNMNWEQLDVLDYISLEKYMDAACFKVPPVIIRHFRINTKGLISLTAHGVFNLRKCRRRPLWTLKLMTAIDFPFVRNLGELMYLQRLVKWYEEVLSGHLPVFGLAYCCLAAPYAHTTLLSFSKFWRASNKFKHIIRADRGGSFSINWRSRVFYVVSKKERLRLYVRVLEW